MKEIKIPYTPRPQQRMLHSKLEQFRFAVAVMHRRAGKTVFAINHLIKLALTSKKRNFRGAFFSPTRVQSKLVAWDYLKEFSRKIPGTKFNETELRADFVTGGRITLFGAENPDAARGQYFDFVVCDEYAQMDSRMFAEIIRPAISDRLGSCLFIGTPQGMGNNFYDLFEEAKSLPEWFTCTFKASETGLVPKEELESAKKLMTEDQYEQEFECSWTANISGSVYGKIIEQMEDEKRISNFPYDPGYPVDVYFDLGISDQTVILFTQQIGRALFVIDCYSNNNQSLDHYADYVRKTSYNIRNYIFPHDIEQRELSTGHSRKEYAFSMGMRPLKVCPKLPIEDGIHAGQILLAKSFIDRSSCKPFLDAMKWYHRKWLDKQRVFSKPVHDFSSHYADAWRTTAVAIRELDMNENRRLEKFADGTNYNPLEIRSN
jgi:phage terminase large subunit